MFKIDNTKPRDRDSVCQPMPLIFPNRPLALRDFSFRLRENWTASEAQFLALVLQPTAHSNMVQ